MPIANLTKDGLKAAWESGVRLDFASVKFHPFFDHFSWLALRTHPDNEANISGDPRYEKLKDWLPKTWEARQLKLEIITRNQRTWLLQEIYDGQFWAIGCRTLEDGDDEPVRIPRQRFLIDDDGDLTPPNKVDWDKGELNTAGENYFDIRVVRPLTDVQATQTEEDTPVATADVSDTCAQSPANDQTAQPDEDTPAVPVGRPNFSERIRTKVEELWDTEGFQALKFRDRQAEEVRAQLCGEEHRFDKHWRNYSSRLIRQVIGQVARAQSQQTGGAS